MTVPGIKPLISAKLNRKYPWLAAVREQAAVAAEASLHETGAYAAVAEKGARTGRGYQSVTGNRKMRELLDNLTAAFASVGR
jgi:hypothetical protein